MADQGSGSYFESYKDILADIRGRGEWEKRQAIWYKLRHNGVDRRNKPYAGAANLHFPLCDSLLERHKPFYYQQLYGTDTFATFVAEQPGLDGYQSAVGSWFDFRLKQRSDFEEKMLGTIDYMLVTGRGVLKMYWDPDYKKLCFSVVDPLYFIVPATSTRLEEMDRCVHVMQLSVDGYKRQADEKEWRQDKEFIKSITGRGDQGGQGMTEYRDQLKDIREGLTYSSKSDLIVIWEIYEKQGNDIVVTLRSPLRPNDKDYIKKPYNLPYDQGIFKESPTFPFAAFQTEIKEEGWYAPRGVIEPNASFETYACKMWNWKADWMDYTHRPTYTTDRDIGNVTNIRQLPGQVLPAGLKINQPPPVPPAFDNELQNVRGMAEYRSNIPDLGAAQHYAPGTSGPSRDKTATEINAVTSQSGISDDMRSRVFRMCLGKAYNMSFSIYLQYDKKDLDYIVSEELLELDPNALKDAYLISPNGSADSWNKGLQLQKATAMYQYSQNNPYASQDEAWKIFLETFNPQWAKRVYTNPNLTAQSQQSLQAMEAAAMLETGVYVQPNQTDDPVVHIGTLNGIVGDRKASGEGFTQRGASLLSQHYGQHGQQMKQKKDPRLKQVEQQAAPFIQYLSGIAQGTIPETPKNVVQMPQQQQQPPPDPNIVIKQQQLQLQQQIAQAKQQDAQMKLASKTSIDRQKAAATVITALANAKKAGVNFTDSEWNALLVEAGLPTLTQQAAAQILPQLQKKGVPIPPQVQQAVAQTQPQAAPSAPIAASQ